MIPAFELSRPTSLDEAVKQLLDGGVPYVGGTELVAAMQIGLVSPPHLVDLKRVDGLSGMQVTDGMLSIGASTRHEEIAASTLVKTHAPLLAAACSVLGNQRVRSTGSIGGNICFADPRSDVTTTLFALGASVVLFAADGRRTIPIDEFVLGEMDTDCQDGELLEAILIPTTQVHHEYLRHQPAEYPTVCIALVQDETPSDAPLTIVVGAVGERPQVFTAPSVDEIDIESILPELDVIEDLNGTEEYKRHLVGVFIGRAVTKMKENLDA